MVAVNWFKNNCFLLDDVECKVECWCAERGDDIIAFLIWFLVIYDGHLLRLHHARGRSILFLCVCSVVGIENENNRIEYLTFYYVNYIKLWQMIWMIKMFFWNCCWNWLQYYRAWKRLKFYPKCISLLNPKYFEKKVILCIMHVWTI